MLKNKEKGRATLSDDLESVPKAMPALMRAAKLQKRAERHLGKHPPDPQALTGAADQLARAQDPAQAEEAAGRLLFEAVRLAPGRRRQSGAGPAAGKPAIHRKDRGGLMVFCRPQTRNHCPSKGFLCPAGAGAAESFCR